MDITNIVTQVIMQGRYPLIFLFLFFEGTTTNFLSSGLAAAGVLNIFVIWVAAIVLELSADLLYYTLGSRMSEAKILAKVKGGERNKLVNVLEGTYRTRPSFTLMVIKFLGPLAIPGIMYLGHHNAMSISRFLRSAAVVAVSRATVISFLGYMVGKGFTTFTRVYDMLGYVGVVVLVFVVLYLFSKLYPDWYIGLMKRGKR